jgi:hypothetical protein
MKAKFFLVPAASIAVLGGAAYATVYLSVQQAQQMLFPGASFTPMPLTLTQAQIDAIERAAGTKPLSPTLRAWRVSGGGWFIADEVVGKHDFIPFALALDASGAVKGVEILEYREAYGGQVRNPQWLAQFLGKRPGQSFKLGHGVKNISGATLSCKHVTDGVRRLLATWEIVLKEVQPHAGA